MAIKHVDVTIRMPKKWFNAFWCWWLDGGGEDGFIDSIEANEGIDLFEYDSRWDRGRELIVCSDNKIPESLIVPMESE